MEFDQLNQASEIRSSQTMFAEFDLRSLWKYAMILLSWGGLNALVIVIAEAEISPFDFRTDWLTELLLQAMLLGIVCALGDIPAVIRIPSCLFLSSLLSMWIFQFHSNPSAWDKLNFEWLFLTTMLGLLPLRLMGVRVGFKMLEVQETHITRWRFKFTLRELLGVLVLCGIVCGLLRMFWGKDDYPFLIEHRFVRVWFLLSVCLGCMYLTLKLHVKYVVIGSVSLLGMSCLPIILYCLYVMGFMPIELIMYLYFILVLTSLLLLNLMPFWLILCCIITMRVLGFRWYFDPGCVCSWPSFANRESSGESCSQSMTKVQIWKFKSVVGWLLVMGAWEMFLDWNLTRLSSTQLIHVAYNSISAAMMLWTLLAVLITIRRTCWNDYVRIESAQSR